MDNSTEMKTLKNYVKMENKVIENTTEQWEEVDLLYNVPETFEFNVCVSIILCVFLVLSIVGNVSTCVVILRNKSMKSPTNYYLLNLAISDLLFSLFIPVEICIYCLPEFTNSLSLLLAHFFFYELLGNFSALIILAFTIERYLAIAKPFACRKLMNSRLSKIISFIWIMSLLCSSFATYWMYKVNNRTYSSWFIAYYNEFHKYYFVVLLIVFFVLPMCVIVVLFILIVLRLNSSKSVLRANSLQTIRNKKKATRMLAAVAASFFICWSPYGTLRVMAMLNLSYQDNVWMWRLIIYLCSINSYMSAVVNPVLYSLMSRKFRQAFKNLLGVSATRSVKSSKSHWRETTGDVSENA